MLFNIISVLKMASAGILFIWQPYFLHVNASWGFDRLTICEWGGTLWCRTAGTDKLWLTSVTFRLQDRISTKPTLHSCCKLHDMHLFLIRLEACSAPPTLILLI